jgi:DNA-binding response OmpR family regulator
VESPRILIVEDDEASREGLSQILRHSGYEVCATSTFEEGRRILAGGAVDLLLVDVRLGAFNGLHLLAANSRHLPAIVMTAFIDPVLEAEARHFGAHYVTKPFQPDQLLALIDRLIQKPSSLPASSTRRWTRKQVGGTLAAAVNESPARILDISYGGLRFEIDKEPKGPLPPSFNVSVPASDVAVQVDLVWQNRTEAGHWLYGAAVSQTNAAAVKAWCGLVDAIA